MIVEVLEMGVGEDIEGGEGGRRRGGEGEGEKAREYIRFLDLVWVLSF